MNALCLALLLTPAPQDVPAVAFQELLSAPSETAGTVSVAVTLSSPAGAEVRVPYFIGGTATGDDYEIAEGPLVIPEGAQRGDIRVTLKADDKLEAAETIELTLGAPTAAVLGSETQHVLRIVDLGGPLVVGQKTIPEIEIKRALVYGPGRVAIEARKIAMLVDQEKQLRLAMGGDAASMEVSEEEYQVVYDREIGKFRERYPSLNLETEVARAYQNAEWYEYQLRQTLEFDKMFFPGDPETWPEITKEAVHASSPQVDLVLDAKQSYDRRKQHAEETGEPLIPEDDMFMGLLRDYVIGQLKSLVTVKTATDGLPADTLLIVEAANYTGEVKTDDFYAEICNAFSAADIAQTRRFLAVMEAAEQRLEAEGFLLSDEAFQAKVDELRASLDSQQSMFSLDFLSLQLHQFPSTEAYLEHMRLLESFRKREEAALATPEGGGVSPALMKYLPTANSVMGLARADAEVLLVSAFDFANYRWKENGWEEAEAQADNLRTLLDEHIDKLIAHEEARVAATEAGENFAPENPPLPFEQFWAQTLDLHSEYWDPPMPISGKMPPMQGMKLKGRFGRQTRNDLERYIGESYFKKFVSGVSIADTVFFEMEPGEFAGPLRGTDGFYLIWLKSRTSPSNPLRLTEPRHVEMLKEDYLRTNFVTYAQEALASAEVVGL